MGARAESGRADGGDVQCHFVPGVATPSVFDPQLPRLRAIPQSERTLAVSPLAINRD